MSTSQAKQDRRWLLAVAAITLVGALLRIYRLDSGLWFDEIRTLLGSVRAPLATILTSFPSNNSHPLYSALANISISAFGEHPWSLRLPALLFGIASLPMLYLLGSRTGNRFDASMATVMLAFSYHHIWFTQNARGYTALMFWTLLGTWLLLKWYSENRRSTLAAYAVVAALGAYTHLTMVFVVISHALVLCWVLFITRPDAARQLDWKEAAGGFVLAGILTVALYLPMLTDMHGFFSGTSGTEPVETPLWALLAALQGLQIGLGKAGVLAAAGVVFLAGVVGYYRRHALALWLFLLPAPVTVGIALAMGRPVYPRFLFFLMGFGLLIAVQGAATLGHWLGSRRSERAGQTLGRLAVAGMTAAVVGLSITSLPYGYRYPKQDYLQAREFVVQHREPGDRVAALGLTAGFPFIDYLGLPWTRVDNDAQFDGMRRSGQTVWVLYTLADYLWTSAPDLMQDIERHCTPVRTFHGTVAGGNIDILKCPAGTPEGPKEPDNA